MVITSDQILNTLKKCVVKVWTAEESKVRLTRCTLNKSFLPPQTHIEEFVQYDGMIVVWDVDNQMWVRVHTGNITRIEPEV